ncbi:hypothetical protein FKM82_007262 [Ascaphus truei]
MLIFILPFRFFNLKNLVLFLSCRICIFVPSQATRPINNQPHVAEYVAAIQIKNGLCLFMPIFIYIYIYIYTCWFNTILACRQSVETLENKSIAIEIYRTGKVAKRSGAEMFTINA